MRRGRSGFLHGQDRFFQMDLLRRQAAGELAEIIGPPVMETDRQHRIHRFRNVAQRMIARGVAARSRPCSKPTPPA